MNAFKYLKRTNAILFMTGILTLFACDNTTNEENITPEKSIQHIKLDCPKRLTYNNPVTLDINQDAKNDFYFTVGLFMNGQNVDQKYMAVSIEDARIRLIDQEAIPYPKDFTIGDVSVQDPGIWSVDSGELMTMTITQEQERQFHGPWIEIPVAYLAVSIRIESAYHFGWIKLVSDTASQCIWITEYAWNPVGGQTIQSGQTK